MNYERTTKVQKEQQFCQFLRNTFKGDWRKLELFILREKENGRCDYHVQRLAS